MIQHSTCWISKASNKAWRSSHQATCKDESVMPNEWRAWAYGKIIVETKATTLQNRFKEFQYLVQETDYKITKVKTKFDMKLNDICHFELFGCVLTLS